MSKPFFERLRKRLARDEGPKLEKLLAPLDRNSRVLEVGCGFGRKLALLKRLGFQHAEGVEVNPLAVAEAKKSGLTVFTPDEFATMRTGQAYDVLLLSHVVEHFSPHALLDFLNQHLKVLRPGGHLVVITPLAGDDFWLDFDHVRPYPPQGFKDFFGKADEQVSAPSPHSLKLRNIYFRRSPWRVRLRRSLVLKTPGAVWWRGLNALLAFLFWASGGVLGRTSGWMGVFEKRS